MEVLWWLAPPVAVTVLAMVWVAWVAREGHGEVSREVAQKRFADAMRREHPGRRISAPPPRKRDRSTGIAVRPSRNPAAEARTRRSA
jgi:hypothetical protein